MSNIRAVEAETGSHGGRRKGSGRKKLSDQERRANETIKLLPGASAELGALAERAHTSRGSIFEYVLLSSDQEAVAVRNRAIAAAEKFSRRQPDQIESAASRESRAALRRQTRRLFKPISKNGPQ